MDVALSYRGPIRDAAGRGRESRTLPDDASVGDALRAVADDRENVGPLVFDADGRVRPNVTVAVDGAPADADDELADGDEVSVVPALAGGRR